MGGVTKAISSIFGGGPKPEKPPAPIQPPPAAIPPTLADATQSVAAQNSKGKAAAGSMFSDTVKTSPQGLTAKVPTAPTSLLGGTE